MFSKPKDLRTEQEHGNQYQRADTVSEAETASKADNHYWKLLLFPLFLLFKLLDYIHLLIFIIFGALLLYFGVTKFFSNSWTETALLISIGLALVIAPILYMLDKDK